MREELENRDNELIPERLREEWSLQPARTQLLSILQFSEDPACLRTSVIETPQSVQLLKDA